MKKKIFQILILTAISLALTAGNYCYSGDSDEDVTDEARSMASAAYSQGVEMSRVKAYDSAIKYFNQALSYDPKMYDAYYNIATIYVKLKRYDDAYNAYVKAIALNPSDYDSILQAAKISYNRQNYSLALKYLQYIPDDYENYYIVEQLMRDAKELFNNQTQKIERSKITVSDKSKKVLIDNFNSPAGMAVDSEGNMFVACYSDNSIVKVDKNKKQTNFLKDFLLNGPVGLAIDKYDNVYVANFDANNILKITKGGSASIFMDNVSKPYFLYIKDDVLYISEQGNDAVVTYDLNRH